MDRCWLTCQSCSKQMPIDELKGTCDCGGLLLVEYDLKQVKQTLTKEALQRRPYDLWRYHELLPIKDSDAVVSLGEGWTPVISMPSIKKGLPIKELWIKREEQNPTGSFKSRGFTVSVSLLNERGIQKVTVPSNGNAASALAAYAGKAGMEATVFLPKDCPSLIVDECMQYGAKTYLVDGLIHDAASIIVEGKPEQHWFNVGTLKEPGRVEGKKTMGLELAEQFQWKLPDVIVYPTGGGSGIIGMWKAFHELKELGMIDGKLPRFISVQEAGCQPLVDTMDSNESQFIALKSVVTSNATGLRVPKPPDGNLLVFILRETKGTAIAVTSKEIQSAQKALGAHGISSSPEGAATLAGLYQLCEQGLVNPADRVVLFNTSHAMKYVNCELKQLNVPVVKNYADWKSLQK